MQQAHACSRPGDRTGCRKLLSHDVEVISVAILRNVTVSMFVVDEASGYQINVVTDRAHGVASLANGTA